MGGAAGLSPSGDEAVFGAELAEDLSRAREIVDSARRVVVLTGAGVSAESGVPTFRGAGGLWKSYRPEELATPEAFADDPRLVWEWYGWRRSLVATCDPNPGHLALAQLALRRPETTTIVTQNVDGLHHRAADQVAAGHDPSVAYPLEVHGAIHRDRCSSCGVLAPGADVDAATLETLPRCTSCGGLMRPDVVWFGEALDPEILGAAFEAARRADVCLVVGTSALVHPAGLGPRGDPAIGRRGRRGQSRPHAADRPFACVPAGRGRKAGAGTARLVIFRDAGTLPRSERLRLDDDPSVRTGVCGPEPAIHVDVPAPPRMKNSRPHLLAALLTLTACGGTSTQVDTSNDVASVTVTPNSPSVVVGATVQFQAQALNATGQPIQGLPLTWASSDDNFATIDNLGLATGVAVGAVDITATIGGVSSSQPLTVQANLCSNRVSVVLNPGEYQSYPGDQCLLLPAGSSGDLYRVVVTRPTLIEDAADVQSVTLQMSQATSTPGVPALAPSAPVAAAPARSSAPRGGIDISDFIDDVRLRARTRELHAEIRQRERDLGFDRMRPLPTRGPGGPLLSSHPDPPARADMFLDLQCNTGSTRPVLLVDFDDDLAIYQDSVERDSDPLSTAGAASMMSYYQLYVEQMLADYWGVPPDVDGNERLIIVSSPSIVEGAASVWSGDFLPLGNCPNSNQGEVIYFKNDVLTDIDDSSFGALGTLAHEAKHVTSIYNGLARGQFHNLWIEEGSAEIAQVMSSRIAWAATGGPALGTPIDSATILGAIRNNGGSVSREMWGSVFEMADIIINLTSHPNSLITNPNGAQSGHTFYAQSWMLHRMVGDSWGMGAQPYPDAPLFKALTDSLGGGLYDGLQMQTGRSFDDLHEDYTAAIALHGTGHVPPRAITQWDLVTSTAIFSSPAAFAPDGDFPWAVTGSGANRVSSFASASFTGSMGPSGMRVHDFVSDGTGIGGEVFVTGAVSGRILVARIQ